jgi:translation elongation factor EF-1beta
MMDILDEVDEEYDQDQSNKKSKSDFSDSEGGVDDTEDEVSDEDFDENDQDVDESEHSEPDDKLSLDVTEGEYSRKELNSFKPTPLLTPELQSCFPSPVSPPSAPHANPYAVTRKESSPTATTDISLRCLHEAVQKVCEENVKIKEELKATRQLLDEFRFDMDEKIEDSDRQSEVGLNVVAANLEVRMEDLEESVKEHKRGMKRKLEDVEDDVAFRLKETEKRVKRELRQGTHSPMLWTLATAAAGAIVGLGAFAALA